METRQQNKMNGRKTANDVLITSFRAGVIASAGMLAVLVLACAGVATGAAGAGLGEETWRWRLPLGCLVRVGSRAPGWSGSGSA